MFSFVQFCIFTCIFVFINGIFIVVFALKDEMKIKYVYELFSICCLMRNETVVKEAFIGCVTENYMSEMTRCPG
jgi:hypothetical protein